MRKAENLLYNICSKIKGKNGYEKDDMAKHKLGPSKKMSAVKKKRKKASKSEQQTTAIKEKRKTEKLMLSETRNKHFYILFIFDSII